MQTFETDPDYPGTRVWRRPAQSAARFLAVLAILAYGLYTVGSVALRSVLSPYSDSMLSVVVIAFCIVILLVFGLLGESQWRIYKGSRELAIRLTKNAIELTLPAYRSLAHPSPAFEGAIPVKDVRAIETRLELYSQFSAKSVMRTYRLVPRSGDPIFLFGEAIPADNPDGSQLKGLLNEMAGHAQLTLNDLGMVQSKAGIFGIWRARPAEWSVATLNTAERKMTWAKVNRTAKLMPYIIFGLIAIRVLIRMFTDHS